MFRHTSSSSINNVCQPMVVVSCSRYSRLVKVGNLNESLACVRVHDSEYENCGDMVGV